MYGKLPYIAPEVIVGREYTFYRYKFSREAAVTI